jgi:hypothetical protein
MSVTSCAAMSAATIAAVSTHAGCTGSGTSAATCASATTASAGEQRAGRCDQQCRYRGDYKKLGHPRHGDLLFVFSSEVKSANPTRCDDVHRLVQKCGALGP